MKPQTRFIFVLGAIILVLGIALSSFLNRKQEPAKVFPATIRRDCAPWDGSAFTVQIPWQNGGVIDISIWQSPEINFLKTFTFPDNSGQVGNVTLIDATGSSDLLNGTVSFSHVDTSNAVEGKFKLSDAKGNVYKGIFNAEWQELMVLCG